MINYLDIVKILITVLLGALALYKTFVNLFSLRKEKLRKDYEFAEKFINDIDKIHDYKLELGYQGLTGKSIDASIIRYFMKQKNPMKKIQQYIIGEKNLVIEKDNDIVTAIKLKTKYANIKKAFILLQYILYCLITFGIFVMIKKLNVKDEELIPYILIFTSSLILAILQLFDARSLSQAQELVDKKL